MGYSNDGWLWEHFATFRRRGSLYEVYTAVFLKVPYYWGRISNNPSQPEPKCLTAEAATLYR